MLGKERVELYLKVPRSNSTNLKTSLTLRRNNILSLHTVSLNVSLTLSVIPSACAAVLCVHSLSAWAGRSR